MQNSVDILEQLTLGYCPERDVTLLVRVFAHGAMGHRINPSWWTLELFFVSASVTKAVVCVILSMG